jgi:MinD superfamily P-loop ATPase
LLVAESTPFGLHDLKIAVEMARRLELPPAVVINRDGLGDDSVRGYCAKESLPVWLAIPDDRKIADAYSRGELVVRELPRYQGLFTELVEKVRNGSGGGG